MEPKQEHLTDEDFLSYGLVPTPFAWVDLDGDGDEEQLGL